MKIKQAKEYFDDGMITGFSVIRDPLSDGERSWLLVIEGEKDRFWTFQTSLGKSRSFATLDAVARQVEAIAGRFSTLRIDV